jgi:chemotaxis family two-component system response regulator Rcp1
MVNKNTGRPVEILLVEDNEGDARLTKEAFKENKINYRLSVARDGEDALKFLKQEAQYANSPRPDLILLDLNLPKKNGREVLEEIKKDVNLRRIPVVILTVSQSEEDIMNSYDLYANCYISKPVDLNQFMEIVRFVKNFWLKIVKLPPDGAK